MNPIIIDRIQAFALSARPPRGPDSSLGSLPVRSGLLIRLADRDGACGWGEVWCNYPPRGNLSRLCLLEDVVAPRLLGREFASCFDFRPAFEKEFARLARHTGETGPFAHCFAAVDTALADLAARRAGLPLHQFLAETANQSIEPDASPAVSSTAPPAVSTTASSAVSPAVAVYASAPDVSRLEVSVEEMLADGHTAAKLKIGFSRERDVSLMRRFRAIAGDRLGVMADANQKWSLQEATGMIAALADFDPRFVEEPLSADAPPEDWARLARASAVPIAAGENICSRRSFRELAARGGLRVLQPDVAKWGGASGAFAVAREARAAGLTCAMHYMGTALGLAASAHVLSAAGGDGPVELDVNPNPLRTELGDSDFTVTRGHIRIPRGDGIGFTPDPAALKKFSVKTADLHPRVRH